ncbi:hypothetical protein QBC42DRAFT_323810 [Cladorrhinum samala]|uniref:Uncharacterized protein n=1 Tax=Cladorrhinum samala TaxID=585594 RepID=A0AAV9HX17_9PEZI|nr:hypothetical protein QBC42DRAFT_323810 [Cladorrhinum samala]
MDHILSRTTIAFESDVFNSFLELRRALWLREPASKLKTAFMIYNHVNFYVRVDRASLTPQMAKFLKSINRMLKVIPHDDRGQIGMLEMLWRIPSEAPGFVRPWKSGAQHAKSCRAGWPKQALFGNSCPDCERALCEYLCTMHIKYQWLKILAHPAPRDITDSWDHYLLDEQGLYPVDMFPTANTYDATHPRIREALKRIPELRPAVALRVYIDIVDDGDRSKHDSRLYFSWSQRSWPRTTASGSQPPVSVYVFRLTRELRCSSSVGLTNLTRNKQDYFP